MYVIFSAYVSDFHFLLSYFGPLAAFSCEQAQSKCLLPGPLASSFYTMGWICFLDRALEGL